MCNEQLLRKGKGGDGLEGMGGVQRRQKRECGKLCSDGYQGLAGHMVWEAGGVDTGHCVDWHCMEKTQTDR